MGGDRAAAASRAAQAERWTAAPARPGGADGDHVRAGNGLALGAAASGDGLRVGHELLASPPRLAGRWSVAATASGAVGTPAGGGRHRLVTGIPRQQQPGCKKGGADVGANPTDRGKSGTKRHLVTDARGTPLGLTLSGANRHDSMMLAPTLDAVPSIRSGRRGRPRRRPGKLHADKAYDHRRCRHECRSRGITPRIARRGIESSARLGRHRWVVERTFAWLNRYRRLIVRYERRADIHLAFTTLACALICMGQIRRFC
jgi:transposase